MSDIRILEKDRAVASNEIILRRGFNFCKDNHDAVDLLNFIQQHTDIEFEWINRNELIGTDGQRIGLRIIKKENLDV
ncbi:MAG: hypothetical protein RIQ65_211 [Pseudomonadota bacterium]|jgi:hypothetical protein